MIMFMCYNNNSSTLIGGLSVLAAFTTFSWFWRRLMLQFVRVMSIPYTPWTKCTGFG